VDILQADDIVKINEVLHLWAFINDNKRFDLFDDVFTEDVQFDWTYVGGPKGLNGIDVYRALLQDAVDNGIVADHHILGSIVRMDKDGHVRVRSRYITHFGDGRMVNGEYLHILRRTPKGWRVSLHKMARRIPSLDIGAAPPEFFEGWPLAA